ncbi:MAG: pyruvate kinase [Acidimicrobiales bacterium]
MTGPQQRDRRTKIVATIGPACDRPEILAAMVRAGMDMARVSFAHGSAEDALARIRRVRAVAPDVGVLVDLPGPKPRLRTFADDGARFEAGQCIRIVASEGDASSSGHQLVTEDEILSAFQPGDRVALGDGGVTLIVDDRVGDAILATFVSGGELRGRPGISVPGGRSMVSTPTSSDLASLAAALELGVDAVAVSFVRCAADIEVVRAAAGADAPVLVAKVETAEAVEELDGIVAVADAVMVARGDLGVRLPLEDVPHIQKQLIRTGVRYGRPVITATQMLESMITASAPTRAEVADIATAVLDGTSAVMLSAETAIGADPVAAVSVMARVARRAERDFDYLSWGERLGAQEVAGGHASPAGITAAITAAGWRAAIEEEAAVIIACTRSGATARAISRFRPEMSLVAATPSPLTARQLTMSWGVRSLMVPESKSTDDIVWFAVQAVVDAGYARVGDVAVVLAGSPAEPEPATDTLRLVRVR